MGPTNRLSNAGRFRAAQARLASRAAATTPLAIVALGVGLGLSAPAHAQSPIIQGWLAANTACKGGPSDSPKTQKACQKRDEIGARLKRRGCEYQEDGDWWKCPRR